MNDKPTLTKSQLDWLTYIYDACHRRRVIVTDAWFSKREITSLNKLVALGLLTRTDGRWAVTDDGRMVAAARFQ